MSQTLARADRRGRLLFLVAAMMVVAIVGSTGLRSMASAQGGPNAICQAMGFDFGFKVEQKITGTHSVTYVDGEGQTQTAGSLTVTAIAGTEEGEMIGIDWSSTFAINAVLVKGGPGHNVYNYPTGSMGDTGLLTNMNPNSGKNYGLSNVVFCYNGLEGGEDPQVLQHTVSIAKWVEGAAPTSGSFDFTATWTADNLNGGVEASGNFTLSADNGYVATTSAMDAGASYSVIENDIDMTCDEGDAYRLVGYSIGGSWAEAEAAAPGASASIANLQSDQYIVVHNEGCGEVSPTGNGSITIVKQGLTPGVEAHFTHTVPGPSNSFTLDSDNNSILFDELPAGDYQFTELPIEGWTLIGAGCSLANSFGAQSQDEAVGNTIVVTLGEDMDLVCTFVNAQAQELQHTVTIHKHVDGALATEGEFNFTATWTADNLNGGVEASGNFTLNQGNNYMITSSAMDAGASYSVVENNIDDVCDPGDEYRLLGYSIGGSLEAAEAADPVSEASFEDLQASQYVIVQNESCEAVAQYTVTVTKYVSGTLATEGSFDFTATWTAANLNGGMEASGNFTLDESNEWAATTSAMDAGASYSVVENGIDAVCEPGDAYRLLGYGIGESLDAAASAEPVEAAAFADLQADQFVVVYNEPCPTGTSSITIVKEGLTEGVEAVFVHDVPGDSDTFTLTAEDNSFTVENLEAGTYRFTELPIDGWRLVGAGCEFRSLSADTEGATLTVVLGEDEHQVCTFVNEMEPRSVTVAKYVDGALAVEGSFDFTETVGEASVSFTLDAEAGFERTLEDIAGGSSYSLIEDGIDAVCDEGDAYRLAGYSLGADLDEALAASPVTEVMVESLTSDLYVIVWNQDCGNIGSITIVKQFQPDSDARQSFSVQGLGLVDFTIGGGMENAMTFADLGVGDYTFTEEFLAGWRIQSIFCSGQQSPSNILINLGAASLTVSLAAGDNITCTFTNVEDASTVPGNITIVKNWGDDEGVETTFVTSENLGVEGDAFTLMDNEGADRIAFEDLAPATYTFTEEELEGWTLVGIACTGMNSPQSIEIDLTAQSLGVNLGAGESIVCTFTNHMDAGETPVETGSIRITKVVNPDLAATFSFTTTGEGLAAFDLVTGDAENPATVIYGGLEAGSYTVTEAGLEGWSLTNIVCEGFGEGSANGDINTATVTIELVAGAEVECTYTNTLDTLLALLGFVPFTNPGVDTPVSETPDTSITTNPGPGSDTVSNDSANIGQQPPAGNTGEAPPMSNPDLGIVGSNEPFINPGQQPETQNPASVLSEQAPQAPSAGNAYQGGSGGASPFGLALIVALLLGSSAAMAFVASRR
jgi:hypothetical protein